MFINPADAVKNNWITGLTDPQKQLQPNAVDFTLDTLKEVNYLDIARIGEDNKQMRSLLEVSKTSMGDWILRAGTVYDGTSNVYIEVPEGCAAILFTRSTFARNGVFIVSGLYDAGYKGHIGFTIYPVGGQTLVAPGTRIGQIALVSADTAKLYAGGYNHTAGSHYADQTPKTEELSPAPSVVAPAAAPESDFVYVDQTVAGASEKYSFGGNPGQRQIQSDPRRTETGMGPVLGGNSDFI